MYMGDTAGNTFKWDSSNADYQTPINGEIETWDDDFGSPHIKKRYEFIEIETNPGCEGSVLYSLDGEEYKDIGDVTKGSTQYSFGDGGFNKKNISLKITDISSTTSSVFYGYVVRLSGEEVEPSRRIGAK
jgi:hypothetical protein